MSLTQAYPSATTQAGQPTTTPQPVNFLQQRANDKQQDQWAKWVDEQYTKSKNTRARIERQWYMNLNMYFGKHYYNFVNTNTLPGNVNGKLIIPPAPPWRVRLISNKIRPIIRTELSRVTSQKPNASVVPASSDDKDLFAAQAGEQVWESFYNIEQYQAKFRRSMWWMLICGTGFMKNWWDTNAQDPCVKQGMDPDTGKMVVSGKICAGPVTPFHIFVPNLREEDIEDQPWVMNVYTRPVEFVKALYKTNDGDIAADVVSQDEIISDAMLNLQGASKSQPDSVLCKEIWLKPNIHRDFPNGGMITTISNKVVYYSENWPYQHQQYPFTKFDHIPSGKFYADSVIVDLESLQREYNRTRSQIVEAKNLMAKPQIRAPRGSVNPSMITTQPGQVIEYQPGLDKPEPMPLQPLPSYVLQELDRITMDMEDISSQHDISKGNTPPGVTAATAISYLQERDDSVMAHTYQSIEEGYQKIATQVLSLAVQYWDIERTIKVTGTDGAFDTAVLKSSDIANGTDIRMEAGSALPTSKAARQAFLMDLMKNGFIDPNKGLELMEIGGVQRLFDQLNVDKRQAQRENLRMKSVTDDMMDQYDQQLQQARQQQAIEQAQNPAPPVSEYQDPASGQFPDQIGPASQSPDPNNPAGQVSQQPTIDPANNDPSTDATTGAPIDPTIPVPVNTWDNHPVHIEVHNNFRKGQSFELLGDPQKRLFELHVQMHIAAMAANFAPQGAMPAIGAAPSGPPGPPPGGGGNQFSTALDPTMAGAISGG